MTESTPDPVPTPLPEATTKPQKLDIRAISIGAVVDIAGTLVFGFVLGLIGGFIIGVQIGMRKGAGSSADTSQQIIALLSSGPFLVFSMTVGSLITVVGGAVTAWLATHDRIKHACLMGMVSLLWGVTMFILHPRMEQLWQFLIGMIIVIPCAALGGLIVQLIKSDPPIPTDSPLQPHKD